MKFRIEVEYDMDPGEDVASAARVLADELTEFDGVTNAVVLEERTPGNWVEVQS